MLLGFVVAVIVVATLVELMLRRRERRPGIGYEDSRVQPTKERSAERWAELKKAAEDQGE